MHTLRSGEHTRPRYSGIQIYLYCAARFQHLCELLAPNSRLITVHSTLIIFRSACIGGAQPLVARARAPVCPSLATPLGVSLSIICRSSTSLCVPKMQMHARGWKKTTRWVFESECLWSKLRIEAISEQFLSCCGGACLPNVATTCKVTRAICDCYLIESTLAAIEILFATNCRT